VSKNVLLTALDCSYNELTSLDVSKNALLNYLRVNYNYIAAETNVTGATSLLHFPSSGWDKPDFYFSPQYSGAPLAFTNNAGFNVPAGKLGTTVKPITVQGGVSGGTAPYYFYISAGPSWLDIDEDTGEITGERPAAEQTATTAVILVEDSSSPAKTKMIIISVGAVTEEPAPGGGNTTLIAAIAAIAAVVLLAVVYMFVIRPRRP